MLGAIVTPNSHTLGDKSTSIQDIAKSAIAFFGKMGYS